MRCKDRRGGKGVDHCRDLTWLFNQTSQTILRDIYFAAIHANGQARGVVIIAQVVTEIERTLQSRIIGIGIGALIGNQRAVNDAALWNHLITADDDDVLQAGIGREQAVQQGFDRARHIIRGLRVALIGIPLSIDADNVRVTSQVDHSAIDI